MSSLHLILGPMASGKSSYLLTQYERSKIQSRPRQLITSGLEHRGYFTRLQERPSVPYITLTDLGDYITNLDHAHDIFIADGHHYRNLYNMTMFALAADCNVYVDMLNGDWKQKVFPDLADLIPYATTITKLSAVCQCQSIGEVHGPGDYSWYFGPPSDESVLPGNHTVYATVCWDCLCKFRRGEFSASNIRIRSDPIFDHSI